MNAPDDDPLDLDAAEFVLGTLRGTRCERFEQRMRGDPEVARRVRDWEARLAPLADGYESAAAPATAWAGIERRLFASEAARVAPAQVRRLAFWRRLALGCASVALVVLTSALYLVAGIPGPQCYAVLADARSVPVAVVFDRRNMRELIVLPVGARLAGDTGSVQLWILAGRNAVAVGLLSPDGETRVPLDKSMLTAVMAADARLLVTREPAGGSPTGLPNGQRIAEGVVALLGAAAPPPKPI